MDSRWPGPLNETELEIGRIRIAVAKRTLDSDYLFDCLYPLWARHMSRWWWTPVAVAARAAELLTDGSPDGSYLDVGSGVGKFCLVAGLEGKGRWTGVEERSEFVVTSVEAKRTLGLEGRVKFLAGDGLDLDWSGFDGVYLFNPFTEGPRGRVEQTRRALLRLSPGARLVTFCGFGAPPPAAFERCALERIGGGELTLWTKRPEP